MKTAMQILTTLALLVVTALSVSAQATIGFKAGFNSNNVYTTETLGALAPDFNATNQVHFGIVTDIPVAGGFSVQPEFNYITKGFTLNQGLDAPLFGVELPVGVTAETQFSYLEVPLLAKYSFGQNSVRPYLVAGPTFGYATSGKIETRANAIIDINLGTTKLNLDNIDYQRFEVGATIGGGLQFDLGTVRAFADARYARGFTELYDIPVVNEKVRNQGFALSAGLMIPLAR